MMTKFSSHSVVFPLLWPFLARSVTLQLVFQFLFTYSSVLEELQLHFI